MTHTLVLAILVVGCAAAAEPWDRQVEGARTTTAWIPEPHPDQDVFATVGDLLEHMRQIEVGTWASRLEDTTVGFVGDVANGSVSGYVLTAFPTSSHPMRAVDLRLRLEEGVDGWAIVDAERRYHCAADEATPLCE